MPRPGSTATLRVPELPTNLTGPLSALIFVLLIRIFQACSFSFSPNLPPTLKSRPISLGLGDTQPRLRIPHGFPISLLCHSHNSFHRTLAWVFRSSFAFRQPCLWAIHYPRGGYELNQENQGGQQDQGSQQDQGDQGDQGDRKDQGMAQIAQSSFSSPSSFFYPVFGASISVDTIGI